MGGRRELVAVPPPAQLTWRAGRGRMRKRGYSLPRLMILCGPGSQRAQGNEARARKAIQALPEGRSDLCCSFLCTVFSISIVFPATEELDISLVFFLFEFSDSVHHGQKHDGLHHAIGCITTISKFSSRYVRSYFAQLGGEQPEGDADGSGRHR